MKQGDKKMDKFAIATFLLFQGFLGICCALNIDELNIVITKPQRVLISGKDT